jgi:class 3 adenylate cyclase
VSDGGERRLVSVVFADLVGYTTLSESRDPEDIRSMLTDYYDRCREIIDRYAGTTDKFIGDAVMGVWGAAEAHEDDAERATRAALELVDMVAGLGGEIGTPELSARAGVLSGEASVGSGGNLHGLVVGDLVNTASRLQSIAPPGAVYVGESTRSLVGGSIEFEPIGEQAVKGKELPVSVFRAKRVLALSRRRTGGDLPDGPFVGRDDELRLLKDQLHATGRESRARMVTVIGEGGIGKSRLSQELLRYIDGITETIYYHSGRSLSYGDGVTFWALGEMIRQRAGILEREEPAKSRVRLRTIVSEFTPSEEDQRWIEPRLAALIGLADMPPGDRTELFAALRAFFQAISQQGTVLMVFEDLHWADEGLLDFIEELVERTIGHPILILCLTRPELLERRPDWAASRKRTLAMHLSRLDDASMAELIAGLAPGLPEDLVVHIAERSGGVPLHAVEFVRMLLNTGDLVRDDDRFEFVGSATELAVPDTINAIISSRLDRLDGASLEIIKDASVLGLTFTLGHLARVRSEDPGELEPLMRELVRREIFELDEDPRSPERGQYGFVQSLIREVAYGRLSRQEKVERHLEVARLMEEAEDPELAMVIASHYASAVEADPSNRELVESARGAVISAAQRAESLRSDTQAATLYERAADMTSDERQGVELKLESARCLGATAREDRAAELAREALEWFRSRGDGPGEVQAVTVLASILAGTFDADKAAELIYPVFQRVPKTKDQWWAHLARETSRALMLADRSAESIEVADAAIPVMEELEMIEGLLDTMINKATALGFQGRWLEGTAMLRGVAQLARDRDLTTVQGRALNNLVASTLNDDHSHTQTTEELGALIERVGSEAAKVRHHFFSALIAMTKGEFEDARSHLAEGREMGLSPFWRDSYRLAEMEIEEYFQGWDDDRGLQQREIVDRYLQSEDPQLADGMRTEQTRQLLHQGRFEDAAHWALRHQTHNTAYPDTTSLGIAAAALAGEADVLSELVAFVETWYPRGRACKGLALLGQAYQAALEGNSEIAVMRFLGADELWSVVATPLDLARARAVFSLILDDHAVGVEKGQEARRFFEDSGMRVYLEGPASLVRDESAADEIAV